MPRMTIVCGWRRETLVEREVAFLGAGAGEIDCLECGGTGRWPYGPDSDPEEVCVQCKGSGKQLVSV